MSQHESGSDEFRLRPASNVDSRAVTELVFGVLAEFGLAPDRKSTDADLQDLENSYLAPGGTFDVLVDAADRIVGCVGLFRIDPDTCELRKMYLRHELRGQGLGRRLLDHALQQARERGFKRVTLETARVLSDAVRLYRRYGFRPYAAPHLSCRCDEAYYLDLVKDSELRTSG